MKNTVLKYIKILLKILLCINFIIFMNLLLNFVINLHPENDGYVITGTIARFINGDGFWTWKKLSKTLTIACHSLILLFVADKTTDLILLKINNSIY